MNWKHVSRKVAKWSAVAAGGMVLCLSLLFGLLQTETGRKGLLNMVAGALADGDRKVELGEVRGVVPFHFTLAGMSVADEHGLLFRLADLEIDWSPLSLLKGEIYVRTLKCGFFHLERLPQKKEENDKSFRLPGQLAFLERIRIDHLSIAEILAGETILGEKAAFRLEADLTAALPGGEWITRLALERTDGPEARLLLNATVRENGRFLILNVDAREAQEGVLSRRAGIKGPIALAIQGEGPCSEWKGRMEIKAGGAGTMDGHILASYAEGFHLDLDGSAAPEPGFLPDFLEDVPPGRIDFSMKGTLGSDRQVHVEHLSLQSGEAGLDLSGSSSLHDGRVRAHFQARHNELKRLEKAFHLPVGGRVVLEGDISGTILNPSAVLRVESGDGVIERVRFSGLKSEIHVEVADAKKGSSPALRLKGQGRVTGLSVRDVDFLPERDVDWMLSGERSPEGRLIVQSMILKGERNTFQLSGEIDSSTWEGTLEAEAETRDLKSLSNEMGMDLPGSGRLKASLHGDFKNLSIAGVLQGNVKPETSRRRAEVALWRATKSGDQGSEISKGKTVKPEVSRRRAEVALWRATKSGGQRSEVGKIIAKAEGGSRKSEKKNEGSGKAAMQPLMWLYPILKEGLDVRAGISLDQGRRLVVSDLRLTNQVVALSAGGTLDLQKRQAKSTTHIRIPDLAPWASAADMVLRGSMEANSALEGSPDKFTLRTEIHGKEVHAGKFQLGRLKIALNGSGNIRANDGSFQFNAGEEIGGISGEGRFSTKGERLSFAKVLLSGPGDTRATGNLDLDLDAKLAEGRFSGECPDLAPFSVFVDQPIKGRVQFKVELAKSRNVQQLNLDFSGENLKAAPLEAAKITLQAKLSEISDNPRGSAGAECRDLRLPGIGVSSLALKATGDGSQVSFDAAAKGALDRRFNLDTKGQYNKNDGGANLTIKQFAGKFGELPFRIPEPFAIVKSTAGLSADSIRLALGGGSLSCAGSIGRGEVDVSLRFEKLPVNLIRPDAFPLDGSGSGELALKGKLERPEGMARVRISELRGRSPELKGVPPAVLEAGADLRGRRLKGELTLRGITSAPFTARMDVPLQMSLDPLGVSFVEGERIEGNLSGTADLARLGGFLGLYDQVMSGMAEVALQLKGTLDRPLITGNIGVENGRYENARSGTVLKEVNVLLVAGTKGLVIERATASDGEGGTVLAQGRLDVDPGKHFPFQVDLAFKKTKIVRHDWVDATGDGDVRLKGSFAHALLSGEVQVGNGEFRIPERLPPDNAELEVIEINGPDPAKQIRNGKAKDSPYLDLDLRLKIPGRFMVRGRGLESEWDGEVRLAGPADKPAVTGELSVERGRFTFLDRRFTLQEGKITLNGLAPPFLDVLATSAAKEMTARLRLIGPVTAPEMKLSSEPPFPPDEVLSRLLFGQSMNRISPLQAIQLAQTLNMMSGRQSLDLMGATRKLLKIDQLEVKQSEENNHETSIAAGKYLRDNVYIEVERSLGPGGTKASVEWEFSPHISVETDVGANAESGVGINWKWDY